ncbi:MAG: hypothetical protein DRJ42_05230 [Deltaproteobacteria bacterium]|nr:MAG: hypothetical protein DRJ42_05230 [Deltaproteobacteria bacterium]
MGKFTVRHVFDVDVDKFWDEVFFDPDYNDRLFDEGLGFIYELVSLERQDDGTIDRKVRTEPKTDAPAAVKKLVGDKFSYLETGHFDPKTRKWTYVVTPSALPNKISIAGTFWVEPKGDSQLTRIVETELGVKIFGVGKVIEAFVEKETKDNYAKAQAFTNKWLKEKAR